MQVESYLRLQLLFGENKAPTFNKNLEKMITLILFDVKKNSQQKNESTGLTVVGIMEKLKKVYHIVFSDSEILSAINSPNQTRIVCSRVERDSALNEYSISSDEYCKLEKREEDNRLKNLIIRFLECHEEVDYTVEDFLDVLHRHFYTVFNSNAATLLSLINQNYDYANSLDVQGFDFTQEEKNAINKFLYWDNAEKNKCVYELVSCCFDYCMITARQGTDAYRNIFNQKVFFLDANIVFRMMGINHINRKKVIDAFIRKCKSLKVSVRVTNTTLHEIDETITHHIQMISSLFKQSEPLDPDTVVYLSSLGGTASFYQVYYNWCKDPANRVADYSAFERDIKRMSRDILNEFKQQNFDSYSEIEPKKFSAYVSSLSEWKNNRKRTVYLPSIKTDVNNFMFVSSLNEQEKGNDFFGTHNYIISADHAFCDWAKDLRPGAIPIVVLPSVWYSIMLQYSTRTNDDYASFTSFLNFSMSNNEGGNNAWKMEVLKKIIAIDETIKIKNEIGYSITEKLKTGTVHDLDTDGVDRIVQEAYHGIIESKVTEARENERQLANERLEAYKEDVMRQMSEVTFTAQSNVNLAKAEMERIRGEAAEERIKAKEEVQASYRNGQAETRKMIIDTETKAETQRICRKYWIITIIMVLCSLAVLIALFLWIAKQQVISAGLKEALGMLKFIIALVAFLGNALIIGKAFCGLDNEKIEKKIRKQIEEKYKYLK